MVNIALVALLIIFTINIFIAILVIWKSPRNKVNYLFFLMLVFLIIWMLSNYFQNEEYIGKLRPIFFRLDFAAGVLTVIFFYLFCKVFPSGKISKNEFILFFFIGFLLIIFCLFTNLILKGIYYRENIIDAESGILFWPYFLFISICLILGSKELIFKYFKLRGLKKRQILYAIIGLLSSAFLITFTNLILGSFLDLPLWVLRTGTYSIVFFSFFTGISIVRYHLFNIKIIIAEILVAIIGIILFIQIFIIDKFIIKVFNLAIFLLFCFFGYLLIRSVLHEIKLKEQLEAANKELKRLDEAKTEFLSIASHQLRTPLTAIKGYLGMIEEGIYGDVADKVKEILHKVNDSNERLIRLVNSLLDISRLELGRMEFEFEKVDIEEMLENIVDEFHIAARKKGLKLVFEHPKEKLPEITIDALKMRQVFLNLVDNAIKYTYEGEIIVKAELKDHGNERIRVSVSDTGMGIARNEINQIFKIYRRGTGVRLFPEGSGVGLYVAKKIVEAHNGKIWVKSQGKGRGSTFYVEMPLKAKKPKHL